MVQILTVSAATAAYASEPLKASARVSGTAPTEIDAKKQVQQMLNPEAQAPQTIQAVLSHSALSAFFLTAGQKRYLASPGREKVEREYLENNPEIDGTPEDPQDADQETSENSRPGL